MGANETLQVPSELSGVDLNISICSTQTPSNTEIFRASSKPRLRSAGSRRRRGRTGPRRSVVPPRPRSGPARSNQVSWYCRLVDKPDLARPRTTSSSFQLDLCELVAFSVYKCLRVIEIEINYPGILTISLNCPHMAVETLVHSASVLYCTLRFSRYQRAAIRPQFPVDYGSLNYSLSTFRGEFLSTYLRQVAIIVIPLDIK